MPLFDGLGSATGAGGGVGMIAVVRGEKIRRKVRRSKCILKKALVAVLVLRVLGRVISKCIFMCANLVGEH